MVGGETQDSGTLNHFREVESFGKRFRWSILVLTFETLSSQLDTSSLPQ